MTGFPRDASPGSPSQDTSRSLACPLVAWRFTDGKRGHDNQSMGLLEALAEHMPIEHFELETPSRARLRSAVDAWLDRTGKGWPDPAVLVGAGHATHLALLAARRARGGRVVVLMKPSLPLRWFDLCIAPEHDGVDAANVFATRGTINRVRSARDKNVDEGLVLLGGPSAHYRWDEDAVCAQLTCIAVRSPAAAWTIASSRRTPASSLARIEALPNNNLRLVRYETVDPDWLPARLSTAEQIWVSADSASMVYEALTAGAATGIIEVPAIHAGGDRVSAGLDRLVAMGWVTRFDAWRDGAALRVPCTPLDEARRCARWMAEHWLASCR